MCRSGGETRIGDVQGGRESYKSIGGKLREYVREVMELTDQQAHSHHLDSPHPTL
jgi:hypothetical protein